MKFNSNLTDSNLFFLSNNTKKATKVPPEFAVTDLEANYSVITPEN